MLKYRRMKQVKITKNWAIVGIVLLLLVGGIYWRRQANKPTYQEVTVEAHDIRDSFELSGKVSADRAATLRFGAGGLVTYVGAQEGDVVKKWQTIASIDSRQLQKVLEQKLNTYAIQRNTFDQTVDDNDNTVPDGDVARTLKRLLEKNQYQLDNTVKDVEYQDLALRLSRLYSPVAGILVHSPVTVSNVQVTAADSWQIVDPTSLVFQADLDELDLPRVVKGQKVEIRLDAYPDHVINTEVGSVSFAPKETTSGTTYEVKISIPASEINNLRLGLNGTATIILQTKSQVPVLPLTAVAGAGAASKVTVLENGKYTEKTVQTGVESDGEVEIVSGLGVGDHVYTKTQ